MVDHLGIGKSLNIIEVHLNSMSDADFDPQTLYVDGFDDLRKAFDQAPQIAMPILVKAMDKSALAIIGEVEGYPPETAANHPGRVDKDGRPMGYYVRGEGWYYPIMRRETIAGIRSGRFTGVNRGTKLTRAVGIAGYKRGKKTSEELGRSWAHKTAIEDNEIVTSIGNNASYVLPVQGPIQEQSRVMAGIGWEAIDNAIDKIMPDIDAIFSDAADEIVAAIAKG